ncbi:DUF6900 domain-containing protein [Lysobacter sp. CA196]|uniref:DUF6900 domain-containing protein n=1 Tax=Lysobacter sp. CA196 TaxID=3455606 RepID=UPI003F8D74A9
MAFIELEAFMRPPQRKATEADMNSELFTTIAQQHLGVDTLEAQGLDSLDFHSLGGWGIKAALTAAYLAGYAASARAVIGSGTRVDKLPTERHTMVGNTWLGEGGTSELPSVFGARTVITTPIPEKALLQNRWEADRASTELIPTAILQRRIL